MTELRFDTIKVTNNGDIKVPLNVDVNDDRARHHHGHERVGADKNSNPASELAPGDSAFISIWYDYEITDADSGKTGTFSVTVSGTSA